MKLFEYIEDLFKNNGVELFVDERFVTNDKGVTIKRDVKTLREISLGVVSCDTSEEWYRICRLKSPVGTIIEDYDETKWDELFKDVTALVRSELTKSVLKERSQKSAKILLDILARRDKQHWGNESKTIAATASSDNNNSISIKFEVKE